MFYFKNKGSHLYAQVAMIAEQVTTFLQKIFPGKKIEAAGSFVRQLEVIDELTYIIESSSADIEKSMAEVEGFSFVQKDEIRLIYSTSIGINVHLYPGTADTHIEKKIRLSSSEEFINALSQFPGHDFTGLDSEQAYFDKIAVPYIPPVLREKADTIRKAIANEIPELIQPSDIKGIIHCHSNWSDGSNTIEEMALAAIKRGLEYLVISDHSKSAFYAQGLSEEKIREQHRYIDELNSKLAPFRIFKSIESDILNDGSLDYSDEVLATFDMVIASVHSNLKMTEEKAMMRLLKAIENPFTTVLGHMTGRLLLSRPGYPVDHKKIIDACAANDVVIELNAHPNRLDIDWRHIDYALEKNVLISIDPDAHHADGMDDVLYGVLVAQKAMLSKKQNLSSFSRNELEHFITEQKRNKLG